MKKGLVVTVLLLVCLAVIPVRAATLMEPGFTVEVFATGIEKPNDLAYDPSGRLLVSETDADRVLGIEILPDGTAGEVDVVASGIEDAEGLALDASGDLYVSDLDAVFKVADGTAMVFASGFNDAEGLAIDQSGDLFVADDIPGGIRVSKIEVLADGSAGPVSTFVIVPGGPAADIDFDAMGDLFVADNGDQVWIVPILSGGSAGTPTPFAGGLNSPFALDFDSQGNLLVGGSSGDIWRIGPDSSVSHFVTDLAGAEGLASDDTGNLFVSEFREGRISKITPLEQVAVDIKPQSCPNPLNVKDKGVLPVAILGTEGFDVGQVDPASVELEGVSPLTWDWGDVAEPFEPFVGKEDCFADCWGWIPTEEYPEYLGDGYVDLTFKFDAQEVVAALGEVEDGDCLVLQLTGNLTEEFGGTPLVGEDVVWIKKKGAQ
jgi:sugar lactone lactonase YvrE